MNSTSIRKVVVAEDEPMILNNLCAKIERENACFRIVGRALNGLEAWEMIERLHPDVLFTDIRMPILDGIEVIRRAAERYPGMQAVIVSGYDDFSYARQAMRYGALDYLLKPVDTEDLAATLRKLHAARQPDNGEETFRERRLIAAALQEASPAEDLPADLGGRFFRLALVHLGNLAGPVATPELASFYDSLWHRAEAALIEASPWPTGLRLAVPQTLSYGRLIVGECGPGIAAFDEPGLERWHRAVAEAVAPYPATLSVWGSAVAFGELHGCARKLAMVLDKGAVPGLSRLLRADADSGSPPMASWLETSEQQKFGTIVQSGKRASFRKEAAALFRQWEESRCPQRVVEKRLVHLFQFLHQRALLLSEGEAGRLESELLNKLCTAPDLSGAAPEWLNLLESAAFVDEDKERDTYELAGLIEHYLSAHFASPVILSELSDKFSFSPSYVTKIFKQYKGVGPLKYLISLRIEEAKRLIARHPELSFREIGLAVGYEDPNYFSRIFKNTTGESLSDYRRQSEASVDAGT